MIQIAIDGPAGAGKSTIAKRVAKELGYIYVDTGALYRTIGLHALRLGVDMKDHGAIADTLQGLRIELRFLEGGQHVFLNGEDVSHLIRSPEVSMAASAVSAVAQVRAFLLDLQRDLARQNSCIMDGRDIGTVVLPNADIKIFLTASVAERARRRYEELVAKGESVTYETVLAELEQRDYNDSHREVAPLKPAADSVIVDTTGYALEDSVQLLKTTIVQQLAKKEKRNVPQKPKAAPKVKFDYSKIKDHALYPFLMFCTLIVSKICFRVKYIGKENVPKHGKVIIAANHICFWDPVFVGSSMIRPVHAMGKEELFRNPFWGWVLTQLNAFPIRRGSSDRESFQFAIRLLESEKILGIFPEGTRSKTYKPSTAKAGVSLIAKTAQADVVPVAIYSGGKKVRPFRTKVTVVFGKPIPYAELGISTGKASELRGAARKIMDAIRALWEETDEHQTC